jgi:hypothetical protein
MRRIALALLLPGLMAVLAIALMLLRRAASDEGRQLVDVAGSITRWSRLRLPRILRWRLAWLIGLRLARWIGLRLARHVGLRLIRPIAGLAAHGRHAVAVIVLEGIIAARIALRPVERLILAILFLSGGNHPEVVFGMLVIIFCRDRVAGSLRVARELHVLFRDMRC